MNIPHALVFKTPHMITLHLAQPTWTIQILEGILTDMEEQQDARFDFFCTVERHFLFTTNRGYLFRVSEALVLDLIYASTDGNGKFKK